MSDYDKADREVLSMPYKSHGPGGELPIVAIGASGQIAPDTADAPQKRSRTDLEKVKAAALRIIPYGVLSGIVFWWQQTGQLAETTGFYALIVLAIAGGFSVGRCANG